MTRPKTMPRATAMSPQRAANLSAKALRDFEKMPGHVLIPAARDELGLTVAQIADLMGVDPQTVWRWQRNPKEYPDTSRDVPPLARRVLYWMVQAGRPEAWPAR